MAGRHGGGLTAAQAVGATPVLAEPRLAGDWLFWLERRPQEGGRTCLLVRPRGAGPDAAEGPAPPQPHSPEGADVRSRLHGYGGGAYAVAAAGGGATVVWVDDRDGCLWRRDRPAGETPPPAARRLSPPAAGQVLADGLIDPVRGLWIGVREQGERDELVAVPLEGGEPHCLWQAADFCGYPVLSPRGSHLAWVTWQRPAMPWQRSQLWLGRLSAAGELVACRVVAGAEEPAAEAAPEGSASAEADAPAEAACSVFQPLWLPRPGRPADLVVACDRSGWWNLERLEAAEGYWTGGETPGDDAPRDEAPGEALTKGKASGAGDAGGGPGKPPWQPLLPLSAEFGMPQWVAGMATTAWDGRQLVAAACFEGSWRLGRLLPAEDSAAAPGQGAAQPTGPSPLAPLTWTPYPLPCNDLAGLAAEDGRVVAIAAGATTPAGLLELSSASGAWRHRPAAAFPLAPEAISRPEALWFAGHGGARTHAWYYPPAGGGHAGAPLLVKGHSGPTAMARTGVSLTIQYWTSRGWGVVDVNYGGSTGFGRAYRQRLDGQWGVADVADCAAAAGTLVAAGLADPQRIAIEGGSAAGFTVLAALCGNEVFRAGACRYAVADLEGMARHSHRFEERYLDSLLGPWPEAAATWRQRSPLLHAERITAPVIFFQGLEDTVVPPEQTERMVQALRHRAVPVEVHLFPGEGHGFRASAVLIQVLEATEAFFRRHFQLP